MRRIHILEKQIEELKIGVNVFASFLIMLCLLSSTAVASLVDKAQVLKPDRVLHIQQYTQFVRSNYDIEYWIIVERLPKEAVLANIANQYYQSYNVGVKTKGKGLLLLIDIAEGRVRVEVGYALEGFMTDIAASQLIYDFFIPRFRQRQLTPAIESSIEFLVEEIKKHLPEIKNQGGQYGSGGGGAEVNSLKEIPEGTLTEAYKAKVKSILVPQPNPESSYRLELAMMEKGFYFQDVDLFDDSYRKLSLPQFPPARLKEMATLLKKPFKVFVQSDIAVIYYPDQKNLGPIFVRKVAAGWQLDRSAVLKYIIYDFSNEHWYLLDAVSPYHQPVKSLFSMTKGKLGSGKPAWMIK